MRWDVDVPNQTVQQGQVLGLQDFAEGCGSFLLELLSLLAHEQLDGRVLRAFVATDALHLGPNDLILDRHQIAESSDDIRGLGWQDAPNRGGVDLDGEAVVAGEPDSRIGIGDYGLPRGVHLRFAIVRLILDMDG